MTSAAIRSLLTRLPATTYRRAARTVRAQTNWARRRHSDLVWRGRARELIRETGVLRLHLGCGDRHIAGMLNCEYRATRAADVIMDCSDLSRFADKSVQLIFANAFFEHVYRRQQVPMLKDCHRILSDGGTLVLLGLPDFTVIAQAYLDGAPGIVGPTFDLFNVYRYTHGDPEQYPGWWTEQLHKSLFDKTYLHVICRDAGFSQIRIFNYCFPGESIALNIGLEAWKGERQDTALAVLPFQEYVADADEVVRRLRAVY